MISSKLFWEGLSFKLDGWKIAFKDTESGNIFSDVQPSNLKESDISYIM